MTDLQKGTCPASPVEAHWTPQLACPSYVQTCRSEGRSQAYLGEMAGQWCPDLICWGQETQWLWWSGPLPTQISVSGFESQALSDDGVKPHTLTHPFKVG